MIHRHNTYINKALGILFLGLLLMLYLNQSLFVHSHVSTNGSIITHAHPYGGESESNGAHHQHSMSELSFWGLLQVLIQGVFFSLFFLRIIKNRIFHFLKVEISKEIPHHLRSWRAPPFTYSA
jgi:hypothetical protein